MFISQTKDVSADTLSFIAKKAYSHYINEIGRAPAPMVADYAQHLREDIIFTVKISQKVVGFAIIQQKDDGYWLETIAVLPDYSGQGIGSMLIQKIEEYLLPIATHYQLYTNEVMREAQNWYVKLGFQETDRRLCNGFQRIYYRKEL